MPSLMSGFVNTTRTFYRDAALEAGFLCVLIRPAEWS